jgi:hypothetical protein
MRGGRRLRVAELLGRKGLTAMDLIQRPEFFFPPATAYRLVREDEQFRALSFEFLEKLSRGLHVKVEDLWIWEGKSG